MPLDRGHVRTLRMVQEYLAYLIMNCYKAKIMSLFEFLEGRRSTLVRSQ